jgi:hypothetical protein
MTKTFSLLDMYMFRNGASSSAEEALGLLHRSFSTSVSTLSRHLGISYFRSEIVVSIVDSLYAEAIEAAKSHARLSASLEK